MGQCHQANATAVEGTQQAQVVLDGVASLYPDHNAGFTCSPQPAQMLFVKYQFEILGIVFYQLMDGFYLSENPGGRLVFFQIVLGRPDITGKNLKVQSALFHLGDIDMTLGIVLAKILTLQVAADGVTMKVSHDGVFVNELSLVAGIEEILSCIC